MFISLLFLPFAYAFQDIAVQLSANAYCDDFITTYERSINLGFDMDVWFSINEYDTNGYIVHNDEYTVTVLRGSHSPRNWIDDFDLRLIDYEWCTDCEVHEGFYNYAMSAMEIVNTTLSTYPDHDHIFIGHSLGSSVIFLANELRYLYDLNTYVYTFGSPRMGNEEFAEFTNWLMEERSFRYTHYHDIVPHIPMDARFEHYDLEYYENEYGNVTSMCDDGCSQQFHIYETNGDDHMWYLDQYMGCYIPVPEDIIYLD